MTPDRIDQAATALAGARTGAPLHDLPDSCRPASDDEAYAIQDAVARRLGQRIGGWKVGAPAADAAPAFAPIYASVIRPSPAVFPAHSLRLYGIEAEIGFRLGRDLPARAEPYDRAEILTGATLHPTIEVVDSRYADFRTLDRLTVLADSVSNGGLVYGAAVPNWEGLDLVRPPIAVTADGEDFAESSGNRGGEPVRLLIALVNHVVARHGSIAAGTFVTTGSHTGLVFTDAGKHIVADFGPLGRVEVSFPR